MHDRNRLLFAVAIFALAACSGGGGGSAPPAANKRDLSSLTLRDVTIDQVFGPAIFNYTATVSNSVTSTAVTATLAAADATMQINDVPTPSGTPSAPIPLAVGNDNRIAIVVRAADGDSQRYSITITRQAAPVAALASLEVAPGALAQIFDPDTLAYDVPVGYLARNFYVTAEPVVAGSAVTVNGAAANAGQPTKVDLLTGSNTVQIRVTIGSLEREYTLTVTRETSATFAQQAYVKASNTNGQDQFGSALDLFGDTLAVGARLEDSDATGINGSGDNNSATDSGVVYSYPRAGTSWGQPTYIKASNAEPFDQFGCSLSMDGELMAVGAEGEDSSAVGVDGDQSSNGRQDSGAVYVFRRNGTSWVQEAYLKASNAGTNDLFGGSLAISGDTLIVGARGESSSATGVDGNQFDNDAAGSGAAYVFRRDASGAWSQEAYLKPNNTGAGDRFGEQVAIDGDTIVVGARDEDSNASSIDGNGNNNAKPNSGAAYVFARIGTTWSQQAYLKAFNNDSGDSFGASVAVAGDRVVVGAPLEDSSGIGGRIGFPGPFNPFDNQGIDSGAAYVFTRSNGVWSPFFYAKAADAANPAGTELTAEFGNYIAIQGDILAIGSVAESGNATGINGTDTSFGASDSGAAYLFVLADSTAGTPSLFLFSYLKASNTGMGDAFGSLLALDQDSIVIAAPGEDSSAFVANGDQDNDFAPDSGAVYVLR